ncbi:uncharacterized protein LOC115964786 [Quercus lobata]|uniref:uncharacterized protein LOC115964786 n=1 Tax=Quercus lobata TaxID=97700 RepID=UPI001244E44B|nr:uncharacterized protein LOC115964786 [Quercus lobata]
MPPRVTSPEEEEEADVDGAERDGGAAESNYQDLNCASLRLTFLNKKIVMFDEMALVVGKDMATRGFSKGIDDIGVEALDDSPPLIDANVDDISKKKQVIPHMWPQMKQENISENQLNFGNLYEKAMKMDGFEENMFAFAFDHLNGDEKQARSFMLKNDKLRRQWL